MKVLVACEYSGAVRDAFIARGHDAMSCDIIPTEAPGPHHQGDVLDLLRQRWDMVIAFPPCTYLANIGARWVADPERLPHITAAAQFFHACLDANSPMVAVENPTPHPMARQMMGEPTQHIQPYEYGHPYTKRTYLWLRGLLPLLPTRIVRPVHLWYWGTGGAPGGAPVGTRDPKEAARTFSGVAAAMAAQWGDGDYSDAIQRRML